MQLFKNNNSMKEAFPTMDRDIMRIKEIEKRIMTKLTMFNERIQDFETIIANIKTNNSSIISSLESANKFSIQMKEDLIEEFKDRITLDAAQQKLALAEGLSDLESRFDSRFKDLEEEMRLNADKSKNNTQNKFNDVYNSPKVFMKQSLVSNDEELKATVSNMKIKITDMDQRIISNETCSLK